MGRARCGRTISLAGRTRNDSVRQLKLVTELVNADCGGPVIGTPTRENKAINPGIGTMSILMCLSGRVGGYKLTEGCPNRARTRPEQRP